MSTTTIEMKSNGNHQSKNDLISEEKIMKGSSPYWKAFGLVVVVTIGAVIITTLVLTIGNSSGDADPLAGDDDPVVETTQAPATESPATNPPATGSPVTNPPATESPNPVTGTTQSSGGETTEAPATNPPATEPPVTNPPATEPPATNPPATESPATNPLATGSPNPVTGTTQSSGGGTSQCSKYPCDAACDMSTPPCNGLIFQEEFDSLNLDIWQHEMTAGGGGNWEFEYYTNNRSNSYVRDGKLFIKPTLTTDKLGEGSLSSGTLDLWGSSPANLCTGNAWYGCMRQGSADNLLNPIQSARLRTAESFSFKYGRLEVEAKLPTGDWLWPAIWLLPKHNGYGEWPASGEIDLVESRGNTNLKDADGVSAGVDQVGSTMHWGPFWPLNGWPKTHATKNLPDGQTFGSGFHKYTLDWTQESMKLYVDDELLLNVDPGTGFWDLGEFETDAPGIDNPWAYNPNKLTPFDQEFYLILNVAVGGVNYFGDGLTNTPPKPWSNDSPTASKDFWSGYDDWYPTWNGEEAAMQVNYVRVYAEPGQTTYHLRDR